MKRLEYTRYVSQGGDHGPVISTVMARQAPAGLLGIHLTMPATVPENAARALSCGDQPPLGLSAGEKAAFESLQTFFTKNAGYGVMMVTRPQTVSYGLSDSPVGLAAWIYDKFAQWTYSGGVPERSLTKDEMLDDITLYCLTNSAISAARFYWENNNNNFSSAAQKTTEIAIPIAVTVFPGEIYRAPKSWTQRAFRNLTYFNQVDKGGHFAAWEDRSFSPLKSDRPFEECDKHTHPPTGDDHEENRNRVVAPPSFRNGWCVCRRWAARTVAATC